MTLADIDTASGGWHSLTLYLQHRRVVLIERCISLETTDAQRAEAAARIAEIDDLLSAPKHAATRVAQAKASAANISRSY